MTLQTWVSRPGEKKVQLEKNGPKLSIRQEQAQQPNAEESTKE